MTCKKLLVVVVLLSVILGVDARSPRKTEKLYRKAGKWQRKLRDVWALLGVKPSSNFKQSEISQDSYEESVTIYYRNYSLPLSFNVRM